MLRYHLPVYGHTPRKVKSNLYHVFILKIYTHFIYYYFLCEKWYKHFIWSATFRPLINLLFLFFLKLHCFVIIKRFIGLEHVATTTSISLKEAIDGLFSRHGLSISRLRRQGYDGASNMQGEFNGLKTLILKENPCAFYIHCFAHQLQLALVAVAKKTYWSCKSFPFYC